MSNWNITVNVRKTCHHLKIKFASVGYKMSHLVRLLLLTRLYRGELVFVMIVQQILLMVFDCMKMVVFELNKHYCK